MRWATRSRFARVAGLLVALASAALWIGLHAGGVLSVLELDSVDARAGVRHHGPVTDVAFVAVDDRTENALRKRWPFPRSYHGRVIDTLRKAGARAIAYDVQFTEPTTPRQDNALIEAIARTPDKVVLATTRVDKDGNSNVLGGEKLLRQLHARAASAILNQDKGGVLRRFPFDTDGLKSFAVVGSEVAQHHTIDPAPFDGRDAWIDYLGPPGTVPTYSYSDVLAGKVPAARFKGRVVVVGVSAPELQDVHPWSSTSPDTMAGGEIQANAISTMLRGLPLRDSSSVLDELIIALLALLAPAIGLRLGVRLMIPVMLVVALIYVGIVLLAFRGGTILPVVDPLGAIVTAMFGTLAVALALGTVERARVRDAFARFVPEAVVGDVLQRTGDDLRLGGVRRDATVLFSDLRGFTSFSETLEPSRVIEVLNRYLESMSDAILDNGGTLVAYMGDGIMAVFGAPLEQSDHADRALAAARSMAGERLEGFNAWLAAEGFGAAFAMGVGLNTGPVMSGNVGSKRRLEYTAIGDTTNTAARLEGMTKGTPHQLFLSDSTRTALAAQPEDLVDVGELEIRGRAHGLRVWALASVDKRDGDTPAAVAAAGGGGASPSADA